MERSVVVNVNCSIEIHSVDKVIALRDERLGLTAYGLLRRRLRIILSCW